VIVKHIPVDARRLVIEMLPKQAVGAEVGVFRGTFSEELLRIADVSVLHLVDPWLNRSEPEYKGAMYAAGTRHDMARIYEEVVDKFRNLSNRVRIHRMTSLDFASQIPDDSLDFVYVDGDHRYDAVRADLEAFWPKVKTRGLVCLDDYALMQAWWGDGVVRATNEFIGAHRVMILLVLDNQIVLRKLAG
jgi:hypothetical protein